MGPYSTKAGKVLALFEGDKDNYENCERVFKSVIEGLVSTVERIGELKIKCPTDISAINQKVSFTGSKQGK